MVPKAFIRLLSRSLASLPTPFTRLLFVASLRDSYTGRYLHEGWVTEASPEEVNQALQQIHRDAFQGVIALPLVALCGELREHFKSLGEVENSVARVWLAIEPFREMVPTDCSPLEQRFFVSQIRTALEVLVRAPDWSELEEPGASPPPQPLPPPQPHWLN